jgi:hypothetical protein
MVIIIIVIIIIIIVIVSSWNFSLECHSDVLKVIYCNLVLPHHHCHYAQDVRNYDNLETTWYLYNPRGIRFQGFLIYDET